MIKLFYLSEIVAKTISDFFLRLILSFISVTHFKWLETKPLFCISFSDDKRGVSSLEVYLI